MKKSSYIARFVLGVVFVVSSVAYGASEEQRQIGSIKTAGNRSISEANILSKVRSRAGKMFSADVAAEDVKRIAELSGVEYSYYNTAVVGEKVQLTFVVVEKNIVRSTEFVGNRKYKTHALRKKLDFENGDWLDPMIAEVGRKKLEEFYHEKGFAFAGVSVDSEKLNKGQVVYKISEGPRVKVVQVVFSGNKAIKAKKLKKAVKTKSRRFFFWPGYYVEQKLNKDVTKLQNAYYKKGFLDAGVTAKKEFSEDRSKARVTFVIEEGQIYTVEEIMFAGAQHFERARLHRQLKLQRGRIYSKQLAGSDVDRLLKLYREEGFINVEVDQRVRFVSDNRVGIEFTVTEGERFRIGQVNITGNEKTQDRVIRRVLDEYEFRPGEWFNADIARGDGRGYLEKLVRSSVVAEEVRIMSGGESPGQRDALVSVTEGQTGMVMLGAGVASDSGLIGQLVFEQRNFDISDWPESFGEFITGKAFKGAGQNFRIALQPGTEVSEYSVSFTEPYVGNRPLSLSAGGSSWERWRDGYDEERLRGYLGFEKRYKSRWNRGVSFRAENVDVVGLDFDAPQEIIDVKGDNSLVGVRLGVGRDVTDDRFNPSSGYTFNAGYEQVGGDHTFGILSGTHRWYRTIYEDLAERKTILATKLHAATILGDAPPFEKFYAGGSTSIRGFDYRGVSTRGLQTNVANPERKDPIGSDWIFLANAEVIIPLVSEEFSALFFVDSGAIDTGPYRAAVGAGIQILIPQWFGPVPMRFELAAPVMKDDDDETQSFSFSIGRLF